MYNYSAICLEIELDQCFIYLFIFSGAYVHRRRKPTYRGCGYLGVCDEVIVVQNNIQLA